MALVTKITAALTDFGLLFPLWILVTIYTDATFGTETEECGSAFFPCYRDCCWKEGWFCDHKEERCSSCDEWKSLCGNDSVPLGCQLYCYKQQQLLNPRPTDADVDKYYIQWSTFLAVAVTLAAFLGIILLVLVTVCVYARRKPPEQWPAFLRGLLGLNRPQTIFNDGRHETNPKATEEAMPMLEQQNPTNAKRPSSASLMTENSSGCQSASTEDLNLTPVDNGDSDSQGQAADHQDDPPPTMSSRTNLKASTSPGRRMVNPGPGPNENFELGSQALAINRNAPAGMSEHPGTNPSSPQQGPQPRHDQPVNYPDFSAMSPTNEIGHPQDRVIATGTDNPARNYDINRPPVQPTDQY